jgi:hypothetical protein
MSRIRPIVSLFNVAVSIAQVINCMKWKGDYE